MKIFFSFFILAFLATSLIAQVKVSGTVVDASDESALSYAHLVLVDQNKGVLSDNNGAYKFMAPSKKFRLKVMFMGYQTIDTIIKTKEDEEINIQFRMLPLVYESPAVTVTANRLKRELNDIPSNVDIVGRKKLQSFPMTNIDDILRSVPNINVNRSWGIFSRNTSITMHGLNSSAHVLILLDGVPMNKTSGGSVNWHMIRPEDVEKIEIVKGPSSALYGNNAMSGVINILSKKPVKKFDLTAHAFGGSMGTFGGSLGLSGKPNKKLYWKLNTSYRQGDGYIIEPEETREEQHVASFLNEQKVSGLIGWNFSENSFAELELNWYDDKRGDGTKVFEEDGAFYSYQTNRARFAYAGKAAGFDMDLKAFFLQENYVRQKESYNSSQEYQLYNEDSRKQDMGLWLTMGKHWGRQMITSGLDIKLGSVNSNTVYRTSTDVLQYGGNLDFYGLFIQDEIPLLKGKMILTAGLRFDYAHYRKGSLDITDPTSKTGFESSLHQTFAQSSWHQLSPKLAARYNFADKLSLYANVAGGFMPPKLDDLSKSGKIRKGFKLANPNLKPESLMNYEVGMDIGIKKIQIRPSVYYSLGNNFQYLLATGDTVDTDRPVFQRHNITSVQVIGAEIGITVPLRKNLIWTIAYAYNQSEILEFQTLDSTMDITGNELNEVSPNLFSTSLTYTNPVVNVFLSLSHTGKQWYDEKNTIEVEAYTLLDMKLYRQIGKHFNAGLTVQNLLNSIHIDRKGMLSPGRFILLEIGYKL